MTGCAETTSPTAPVSGGTSGVPQPDVAPSKRATLAERNSPLWCCTQPSQQSPAAPQVICSAAIPPLAIDCSVVVALQVRVTGSRRAAYRVSLVDTAACQATSRPPDAS